MRVVSTVPKFSWMHVWWVIDKLWHDDIHPDTIEVGRVIYDNLKEFLRVTPVYNALVSKNWKVVCNPKTPDNWIVFRNSKHPRSKRCTGALVIQTLPRLVEEVKNIKTVEKIKKNG